MNFRPQTAENGWQVCAHPPKFLHYKTLPDLAHGRHITDSKQTFGTCYVVARAYSLEQQNAGRAQAELCHVSSLS